MVDKEVDLTWEDMAWKAEWAAWEVVWEVMEEWEVWEEIVVQ